jgi:hypothetical protein
MNDQFTEFLFHLCHLKLRSVISRTGGQGFKAFKQLPYDVVPAICAPYKQ